MRPSATTTAPTKGLGEVSPRPRSASPRARSMYASSSTTNLSRDETRGREGTGTARRAPEPAPPVLSHPDSHGRSRNLAGSTPEWLSEGRGLSPPVGICTPPRRRALGSQYRRAGLGGRGRCYRAGSGGGATADRVGGAGLALGER